ncbi:MAG: 50S ribosomal protein L6 [Ruminococcaceae bacterium]|nr:50S ribosomal protein L6 [Oscillospiraceae bacterium]
MSRIGRKPIVIPEGVDAKIEGNSIVVKGPKGELSGNFDPLIEVELEGNEILVKRSSDEKKLRELHGLTRTLLANMVLGVTEGFKKELEIQGVGYRAQKQGNDLVMNLGYSHQVIFSETDEIKIEVPSPTKIIITGIDKQKVGQFAAEVRGKRPPEPYKGKGIRYVGEYVIRKEGKAGKTG